MLVSTTGIAAAAGGVVQPVQFQVAGAQLQPRLALAPQQCPAAGPQLMQAEGLDHQVVGAQIEAANACVHLLPGGEHQHRQIGVERADLLEHLFAILDRHVQVENGQIGHLLAKGLHRCSPVVGQANTMPVGLQAAAQKQSQCLVIFGDQ